MSFPRLALVSVILVSAHLAVGCGGKAVDDPGGDGDGDGDQNGDGDDEPPPDDVDPLSDAGFPGALEEPYREYCRNLEACDAVPPELSCGDAVSDVGRIYNVEERQCRDLILGSLRCLNDSWSNCAIVGSDCVPVANALNQMCAVF